MDRTSNGRFSVGNKLSPRLNDATKRSHFFNGLATEDDLRAVYNRLLDIALNCPDGRTQLNAILAYLDRVIGRPQEAIDVEITAEHLNTDEALMLLRKLMNASSPPLKLPSTIPTR